jgi:hypothetical protein
MKKFLTLTAILLLAMANSIFAEAPMTTYRHLDRATAERAFEQLTRNAQKGLLAPNAVAQSKFIAIEDIYLPPPNSGSSTDRQPVNVPITNGMKVWFEGTDGKLINPSVYRFSPNEEFFVHVEAAVPVFVTLYQHFPRENGKAPILRYPDQDFPSSYRILNPAVRTKLFTKFRMDDGHEAEYMSIVVVRADWEGIAEDVPAAAITAVDLARADSPEAIEAIYRRTRGLADISSPIALHKLADVGKQADWTNWDSIVPEEQQEVVTDWRNDTGGRGESHEGVIPRPERTPTVQFLFTNYRTPPPQWDGVSDEVREVANYLFSNTGIGHLQIVLNKIERVAP